MEFNFFPHYHTTVLGKETVLALDVKKGGIYVDGTLGGGGHSELILKQGGRVIGFDKDLDAIEHSKERLKAFGDDFIAVNSDFKKVKEVLKNKIGEEKIEGAVLDLGVSSSQIDNEERGFSYMQDGPLDMRMDKSQKLTAKKIVNEFSQAELEKILFSFGEEKLSKKIVRKIIELREKNPVTTTKELSDIVIACYPPFYKKGHPAKKTFQALRIAVNNELDGLQAALENFISVLKPKGRLAVISFHSLEDRIVKTVFNNNLSGCICLKSVPVCVCKNYAKVKQVIKRQKASLEELLINSRSKSATLRVVEKI